MARLFDAAVPDYVEMSGAVVTAYPFTVMGWAYINSIAAESTLWCCSDKDVSNHLWRVTATPSNKLAIGANSGSTFVSVLTTTSWMIDVWFHWCGVFTSATSRTIYLNAGGSATQTTSRTPSGLDTTSIGRTVLSNATDSPARGRIDYVGVWNVALGLNEITAGARGVHPLRIRGSALIDLRILGLFSPEPNIVGPGNTMTVTGTTPANGPPVELLLRPGFIEEAAVGGRTSKNTRSFPLGVALGMRLGIGGGA